VSFCKGAAVGASRRRAFLDDLEVVVRVVHARAIARVLTLATQGGANGDGRTALVRSRAHRFMLLVGIVLADASSARFNAAPVAAARRAARGRPTANAATAARNTAGRATGSAAGTAALAASVRAGCAAALSAAIRRRATGRRAGSTRISLRVGATAAGSCDQEQQGSQGGESERTNSESDCHATRQRTRSARSLAIPHSCPGENFYSHNCRVVAVVVSYQVGGTSLPTLLPDTSVNQTLPSGSSATQYG
jgi:hypothetical protein